jgi:hypothetical protein
MFCDRCGLQFQAKQSACDRCHVAATRHWLQLISLLTLLVAVLCNSLVGQWLLPRLAEGRNARLVFRAWLWFDNKFALYGWLPIAAALLAWDFLVWKAARPKVKGWKVKGWITRKLLTFSLAAGLAPMLPWWIPAGQPPGQLLSAAGKYLVTPALFAWGVVLIVVVLLCSNTESRDCLLGHGKVLSVVSLGLLSLVMTMTVVCWSIFIS